jgi:putative ABC transport system ATP-binding protein
LCSVSIAAGLTRPAFSGIQWRVACRDANSGLVVAENISKVYRVGTTFVPALRGVSLSVQRGDFAVIAGPSGSGKTTLLNLLGSIDFPTSGNIYISGQDVCAYSDDELSRYRARKVGFIFQNFNLIPVLSAYENVEYPLRLNRISKKELVLRTLEMLEAVGLTGQLKQRPSELSGGQQQRVAIARALINRPELVLADEPTASLDSETGAVIIDLMRRMKDCFNATFVISTHDPMVVEHAEQHFYLKDGRLTRDHSENN